MPDRSHRIASGVAHTYHRANGITNGRTDARQVRELRDIKGANRGYGDPRNLQGIQAGQSFAAQARYAGAQGPHFCRRQAIDLRRRQRCNTRRARAHQGIELCQAQGTQTHTRDAPELRRIQA